MRSRLVFLLVVLTTLICNLTGCQIKVSNFKNNNNNTITHTPLITNVTRSLSSSATLTSIPIMIPTPTYLPTIAIGNEMVSLMNLVQNNGGCLLPCIMGLTPGLSNQLSIEYFNSYFSEYSRFSDDKYNSVNVTSNIGNGCGGVGLYFWKNLIGVNINIDYYGYDGLTVDYITLRAESESYRNGGILRSIYGDPYYDELMSKFTLQTILRDYRAPERVLIMPIPEGGSVQSPRRDPIFNVVLLYESKGFVVQYVSLLDSQGNSYLGCPNQAQIYITVWNPDDINSSSVAEQYYSNLFGSEEFRFKHYQLIEDVTEFSIADFYQAFLESSDRCIETTINLWPYP